MKLEVIPNPQDMKAQSAKWRTSGLSVGFVPTMGALHAGHEELIKVARAQNDIIVLSIFVNPTQFNDKKDLEKYPKTFDADLEIATRLGVDVVFAPQFADIYPDNYAYILSENSFSKELCGASRPGHFDGVLTIVIKLFNIVSPMRAYFGEKDFQQLELIRNMVAAFFMDVEIVAIPIVRQSDGLALSSRNVRLNENGRKLAPEIYKAIKNAKTKSEASAALLALGFEIDYVKDIENRRYVAVRSNDTIDGNQLRLIDNVEI